MCAQHRFFPTHPFAIVTDLLTTRSKFLFSAFFPLMLIGGLVGLFVCLSAGYKYNIKPTKWISMKLGENDGAWAEEKIKL